MNIKINRRIVPIAPYNTESEIYDIVQNQLCWPQCVPFLIWDDNQIEITNDDELKFVCRMLYEERFKEFNKERREFEDIEERLARVDHEEASDSENMHSEDDITQEDFYQMGYRREIT